MSGLARGRSSRPPLAAIVALLAGLVGATQPARAQGVSPNCTVTPAVVGNATDICRKAADVFAFVVPQLGVALAGGNPVLGEGGTLGGWGKRSLTLRVSAVDGLVPQSNVPLTLTRTGAVGDQFGAKRVPVPMPSVDAAIGVVKGIPLGLTNIGGVDVLLGATVVPTVASGAFRLAPAASAVAVSYGARVGLLQESAFVPGVSVSYMRRKVPTLNADYTTANDTLQVRNASLTANALRLVASKRLAIFGVAAGIGRDDITGVTGVRAIVNEPVLGTTQRAEMAFPVLRESVQRNTAFVNASLSLIVARLVAEYGRSSAGALRQTLNTFDGHQANDAYSYGSVGITVRF